MRGREGGQGKVVAAETSFIVNVLAGSQGESQGRFLSLFLWQLEVILSTLLRSVRLIFPAPLKINVLACARVLMKQFHLSVPSAVSVSPHPCWSAVQNSAVSQ